MKRLLSLLLVFAMAASYLPVTAGAEETVPVETGAEIIETTVPAQTEPVETTEEVIPETSVETVPVFTAPQWELSVIPDKAMELPSATTNGYSFATFARDANGNPSLTPGNHEKWIDRVDMEAYTTSLYNWLEENSDNDGSDDALIDVTQGDEYLYTDSGTNAVLAEGYVHYLTMIGGEIRLDLPYDVDDETFSDAFYDAVYSVMDENLERVSIDVCTVFDAFDRDHPEVFWLEGRSVRTSFSYYYPEYNGTSWVFDYEQDFLLDLSIADYEYGENIDIRATDYQSAAAIRSGITKRDNAVNAILAQIPANTNAEGKVAFFNDWLTKHNGYNTSADLYAIGYDCRECLSALTGTVGTNGPVCEGYARAFKVLCDAVNIPCVLVNGDANNGSGTEPHMWNYVNILGSWYGVDVTWNDPGSGSSAVSGYECEDYLLAGANTVVGGMAFSQSHPVANVVTDGGVAFTNGPKLSEKDYCVHSFGAPAFRFENDIFYADFICSKCGSKETVPGVITSENRTDATATKDGSIVYTVTFTSPDGKEYTHTHTVVLPATGEQEGYIDNGTLGENLTWTLDMESGVLTISGTGFMDNKDSSIDKPWYEYQDQISKVVIEEGVTSIGENMFALMPNLTEVQLPKTLRIIKAGAFEMSEKVKAIDLTYVERVEAAAFHGCTGLTEVTIPDSIALEGYDNMGVFSGCTGIQKVTVGNFTGGYYLFSGCTSLTDVTLKEGLEALGGHMFDGCTALKTVNIPAGADIGGGAFANCTALTNVTFTREIGTVGEHAFKGCIGLTSFTFPQVEALSGSIFFLCDHLSTIYFKGSAPTFDRHTLNNIKVTIYYPSGDSSWNDKINGHFGANIDTWVPYNVTHTYQNNLDTTCDDCGYVREVAQTVKTFSVSGDLSVAALSQDDISQKYATVTTPTKIFDQQPSVTAPYATGKLSQSLLNSGLTLLNYFRYVTKLPSVQLDETLTNNAQHGAVLLAAIDELTHYPSKPADMEDAFYKIGAASTSSSNISWNMGYSAADSLYISLMGCLHDSGTTNISTLGHRRWLLNPTLLNVGFGYAQAVNGSNYSTTQVFDRSGRAVDYDFISFPASGNFPKNLFKNTVPWSVTLNPQRFETPNVNQLTVTITRQSDGKVWTLDSSTGAPVNNTQACLGVNTQGYGVSNCIIFTPGANSLTSCDGIFTVEITGLKTRDGKDARLLYEVNFFDTKEVDKPHTHEYTKAVTAPTCTEKGYTTYTCTCGHSYVDDYTNALGHTEVVDAKVEPTCTESGLTEGKHCSVCNTVLVKQEAVPAKGHTEVIDPKVEPTCTEKGKTAGKHCSVCNEVLVAQEEIPATNHKWDNGKVTKEPTATEDGAKTYTCANCGETKTEVIPATGEEIIWGDANSDSKVNYRDIVLLVRYVGGRVDGDQLNLNALDLNGDGGYNYRDIVLLVRYVGNRIDKFPVENDA